jgi:hypothetical protein
MRKPPKSGIGPRGGGRRAVTALRATGSRPSFRVREAGFPSGRRRCCKGSVPATRCLSFTNRNVNRPRRPSQQDKYFGRHNSGDDVVVFGSHSEARKSFLWDVCLKIACFPCRTQKFVCNFRLFCCLMQVPWHVEGVPLAFPLCCQPHKFPLESVQVGKRVSSRNEVSAACCLSSRLQFPCSLPSEFPSCHRDFLHRL